MLRSLTLVCVLAQLGCMRTDLSLWRDLARESDSVRAGDWTAFGDRLNGDPAGDHAPGEPAGDRPPGEPAGDDRLPGESAGGDRPPGESAGDDRPPGDSCPGAVPLQLLDCSAIPIACTAPLACTDLVALYHFDTPGDLTDFSGSDNHGTCPNVGACPVFNDSAGRFDGAFVYDGDDHFEVPDDSSLDIPDAVTISAWFYPTSLFDDFTVVVAKLAAFGARSNYWLGHTGNNFVVTFIDDGNTDWFNHDTGHIWSPNTWYHLVAVIDNPNDGIELYVNGVPSLTNNTEVANMGVEDGSLWIGWGPDDLGAVGIIDEVAIWRRALAAPEIAALYP